MLTERINSRMVGDPEAIGANFRKLVSTSPSGESEARGNKAYTEGSAMTSCTYTHAKRPPPGGCVQVGLQEVIPTLGIDPGRISNEPEAIAAEKGQGTSLQPCFARESICGSRVVVH